MISLSDSELQIVLTAAKPLAPQLRAQFLRDCAAELARYPEVGPGVIHRVVGKLQQQHLNAPRKSKGNHVGGKYGH